MKIITVSREFGSGGREIGKRLADILQMDYYDREIIQAVAEQTKLDEKYIESTINSGRIHSFPISFGKTLSYKQGANMAVSLLAHQHKIIKAIAEKGDDFVIVGRSANVILQDYKPYNIFVYADLEHRMARCRERDKNAPSDKELKKLIKHIDRNRKDSHALVSELEWGDKRGYHLCVNTSEVDIKQTAELAAAFANAYWGGAENEN